MTRPQVTQQGFTLLEVLIALALMALVSIISWQALDLVQRSSERLNASTDDTLALVRVLGQLESDISRHAGNDILPSPASADAAEAARVALLPSGIVWDEPVLSVVRSAHDGAWRQVAWDQDGDTLRRAVGPSAHVLPVPGIGAGDVVLEQVQSFTVRAWVPGQGWVAPGAAVAQPAATGLEIVIGRRRNGANELYRKVVLLP